MPDIIDRLETFNEYCESAEARQLRKDAAEVIRRLQQELRDAKAQAEQAA